MPNDLANLALAPVLAAFAGRYPKVALDIDLSARFVDLVALCGLLTEPDLPSALVPEVADLVRTAILVRPP